MMLALTQVDPLNLRERSAPDSLLVAEFSQQLVNVRKMVRGHVLKEEARNFVVANAAIDPSHKNRKLNDGSERHGQPIGVQECMHGGPTVEFD